MAVFRRSCGHRANCKKRRLFTYFYVSSGAPGRSWVGLGASRGGLVATPRGLEAPFTVKSDVKLSTIIEDRRGS